MDKEDVWTIKITIYTIIYMLYILLEGRDNNIDVPIALLVSGLWLAGMLNTTYQAYKGSI